MNLDSNMSFCFNPNCSHPENEAKRDTCHHCDCNLIIKERYRSLKLLGKSQLALTLEVADLEESNRHRVLKILLSNYSKAVELFQQEAILLQQIKSPGIPQVEPGDYFTIQTQWSDRIFHCIVMEKIPGSDLQQYLATESYKPISNQQAIDWLTQIVEILAQLHQKQYFHRDIKPANIILQPNNKLALIDFGAAREVTTTYLGFAEKVLWQGEGTGNREQGTGSAICYG